MSRFSKKFGGTAADIARTDDSDFHKDFPRLEYFLTRRREGAKLFDHFAPFQPCVFAPKVTSYHGNSSPR
jgi:hypothetical protein